MSKRPETQKAAEKAYREKFVSVLVRFTPAEAKKLDAARGDFSRAVFLKRRGLSQR